MNIDTFLKSKQVRFIGKDNRLDLTNGKVYDVIGVAHERIKVHTDNGGNSWYDMDCFELVSDPAEKPPQVAGSKFAAGEKVYFGTDPDIKIVSDVNNDNTVRFFGEYGWADSNHCCPATQENYEKLCSLFEGIDFEQPPKVLTGSDLCRAMLEKGWKYVPCYVHDGSDDEAINRKHYVSVKNETPRSGYNFSGTGANDWKYAVPIDPRTGEPLIQAVLDE